MKRPAPAAAIVDWKAPAVAATTLGGKLYALIEFLKQREQPQSADEIQQALKLNLRADHPLAELVGRTAKIQVQEDGRYAYKVRADF